MPIQRHQRQSKQHFFLNRQNIFIKLFHSFRKIIVYLQRQLHGSTFPLRIQYSMRLYKTYIMAFSKRFDFDDVRTSQTPITCHKSKQRERPMRCILCVSGQPAAYLIITYIIVGLSRCSVYRQVGNAKAFTS